MFDRAKEIFIENLGSQNLMCDNGCLEEYLQYNVPKEMEYAWKDEFIEDQFSKASTGMITIDDLIRHVCIMAGFYGNQSDYKRIFGIKRLYLNGSDMFRYVRYLDIVLDSIRDMLRHNEITLEPKLEIVSDFEDIIDEIINGKDNIEDKTYHRIAQKYGLGIRENYNMTNLRKINDEVKGIKQSLANLTSPQGN